MTADESTTSKRTTKQTKCIIFHDGDPHDVSDFFERHPGGKQVLLDHHNQDITRIIRDPKWHVHSRSALKILDKYKIKGKRQSSNTFSEPEWPFIDWNRPMVAQVSQLGSDYDKWAHTPVDRDSMRLFESDWLEMLSKSPWYLVPLFWIPIVSIFLYSAFSSHDDSNQFTYEPSSVTSTSTLLLAYVSGVFLWSLLEYLIHRFIFHAEPPGNSSTLIRLHFVFHGLHHKVPFDPYRLVFPPAPAAALAIPLYSFFSIFLPSAIACSLMAGLITGFVCYDMTHYYIHHGVPSRGSYFHGLKSYHVQHHFKYPKSGFGVSSKLWDYPFNTLIRQMNSD